MCQPLKGAQDVAMTISPAMYMDTDHLPKITLGFDVLRGDAGKETNKAPPPTTRDDARLTKSC